MTLSEVEKKLEERNNETNVNQIQIHCTLVYIKLSYI